MNNFFVLSLQTVLGFVGMLVWYKIGVMKGKNLTKATNFLKEKS